MNGYSYNPPANPKPINFPNENSYFDVIDRNPTDILRVFLYDLNSAIAPRKTRLQAIHAALDRFDHYEETLHNEELELRVDHILLQKLSYAMSVDLASDEVGYICSALEMVYRAGKGQLAKSFHEISDAVLPMFVKIIRSPSTANKVESLSEKKKEEVIDEMKSRSINSDPVRYHRNNVGQNHEFAENHMHREQAQTMIARYATQGNNVSYNVVDISNPSTQNEYCVPSSQYQNSEENISVSQESWVPQPVQLKKKSASEFAFAPESLNFRQVQSNFFSHESTISYPLVQTQSKEQSSHYTSGAENAVESQKPWVPSLQLRQSATSEITFAHHSNQFQHFQSEKHNSDHKEVVAEVQNISDQTELNSFYLSGDDAIRLRGGGTDSAEEQVEERSHDNYNESCERVNNEISDQFGILYEGSNYAVSSANSEYDDDNPFSDASVYETGESQNNFQTEHHHHLKTNIKNNMEEFENYHGQVLMTDEAVMNDKVSEFTSEYANDDCISYEVSEKRYEGQVEVDQDRRGSLLTSNCSEYDENKESSFSTRLDQNETGERGNGKNALRFHGGQDTLLTYENEESHTDSPNMYDRESEEKTDRSSGFHGYVADMEILSTTNSYVFGEELSHQVHINAIQAPRKDTDNNSIDYFKNAISINVENHNLPEHSKDDDHTYFEDEVHQVLTFRGEDASIGRFVRRNSELTDDWGDIEGKIYQSRMHERITGQHEGVAEDCKQQPDFSNEWDATQFPYSYKTSDTYSKNWNDASSYKSNTYQKQQVQPKTKLSMVKEEGRSTFLEESLNIEETPEEDIFQFEDPKMAKPKVSQQYFHSFDSIEPVASPLAVKKVLKILRYFSRVLSAMEALALQPGLVDALLYQMSRNRTSAEDETSRVDAIACVVNLACAEENKVILVFHPGLLDAVISIANHNPIEEARELAAIVLMNLAYAEENKVYMVKHVCLLDTLVHLLSDVSPFTRRYASAALFTLACMYANTAVMARYCEGGILEALRKVLLNDPIDEARVNAAEALFNMARNNSEDAIEIMGNHPKLLASLAHSVLTDYSADVRAYSARALEWLSADIHHPMPCHARLLKALTTASQWTKTTCIAEALKMQATLSENRRAMVEQPGMLDSLAKLAMLDGINDEELKICALSCLERLSKEVSTRHIMAKNEGVMTALTKATFFKDGSEDDVIDNTPINMLMKSAIKSITEHL